MDPSNGQFVDAVSGARKPAAVDPATGAVLTTGAPNSSNSSFDSSNKAERTEDINPDWSRWTATQQVSVTNETNATVDRYVDMDGYNHFSLQFEKTGGTDTVTLKVYGSLQDDGTADSSKTYQDITQYGMEVSTAASTAASYTADATIHLKEGHNYKTLKIETVSAGGNNDADYSLYGKKWFA